MEHHTITRSVVRRETFEKTIQLYKKHKEALDQYLDRLIWWNSRINLVSRSVPRETIKEHLYHSLLLSQFKAFTSANSVIDAGTGGGLPGIPLGVAHPNKTFLLNDIVSKKCLAVKQMAQELGLKNISIKNCPIAQIQQASPFLLLSKHAFRINDLYAMTAHLPWETLILYKGLGFEQELEGITDPLSITSHNLSQGSPFYNGKALVILSRG